MDDVVERILLNYQLMRKIDADRVEASREKIAAYIQTLNIGRQFDAHQLTMYGLAYLKELHKAVIPGSAAAELAHPNNSFSFSNSSGSPSRG
jgi:hypothetical protein